MSGGVAGRVKGKHFVTTLQNRTIGVRKLEYGEKKIL